MDTEKCRNYSAVGELSRYLRQEQLYIQQEQAIALQLSEAYTEHSVLITKLAYVHAHEKENLNDATLIARENGLHFCCQRANNLKNATFVDSKKVMEYEHALATEDLLNFMYTSPRLVALSLCLGDRLEMPEIIPPQQMNAAIKFVAISLLGNAVSRRDADMMLKLLRELAALQIVNSNNPIRMLHAKSSAFARLYYQLNHDSLFSAKLFLITTLYEPLMAVFADSGRLFSAENLTGCAIVVNGTTADARFNADCVTAFAETKLREHVKLFIRSLAANWSLFPFGLRWLIRNIWDLLTEAQHSKQTKMDIIIYLVFTSFICPAIVSPNIMGIVNIQISEKLRLYLAQIVQAIQILALNATDGNLDPKFAVIQADLKENNVNKLIDQLLTNDNATDFETMPAQDEEFERSHFMSTQSELRNFVEYMRVLITQKDYSISTEERQKLEKLLARIPVFQIGVNNNCTGDTEKEQPSKQSKINLRKIAKVKIAKSISFSSSSNSSTDNSAANATENCIFTAVPVASVPIKSILQNAEDSPLKRDPKQTDAAEDDVILFWDMYRRSKPKLLPLSEDEVLIMNKIEPQTPNGDDNSTNNNKLIKVNGLNTKTQLKDSLCVLHTKNAQFSALIQDDISIGNSDNLEVVSEAPSNHSVTSSLELEEENDPNDNLSDMVSANVSGRGSPNISGRDTPSSQVTDGGSVHNALPAPQIQKLLSKARSDIEDKFCKFEIKKFEGDETVSIISDTWSTDVLASDSEMLDTSEKEHDRNFSTPLIPTAVVLPGDDNFLDSLTINRGGTHSSGIYMDTSDQRSESNWSTDVLASDSEKFTEIDTDDNVSITARSDITDGNARSETERDILAATISTNINSQKNSHHKIKTKKSADSDGSSAAENVSDHSQEDSAFFDAINNETADVMLPAEVTAASGVSALRQYQGPSSLARSSVCTTNPFNGENSFQWNYKCGNNDSDTSIKTTSLSEKVVSNDSSNSSNDNTTNIECNNAHECADLIDLSGDFNEMKTFDDETKVQRRLNSTAQRNAGYDGRRNGILASGSSTQNPAHYRRHQSLNYENHEIMLETLNAKRAAVHSVNERDFQQNSAQTDDDKQKILLLCTKSSLLNICDDQAVAGEAGAGAGSGAGADVNHVNEATTLPAVTANTQAAAVEAGQKRGDKPTKSTGAIPKSISFDTTADKRSDNAPRLNNPLNILASDVNAAQSSIFTKLKHGIFKHKRNGKSSRRSTAFAVNVPGVDGYTSGLYNGGALNASGMENSLDMLNETKLVGPLLTNIGDFNEDILAKYRRKVSTSSEATNSDSLGISRPSPVITQRNTTSSETHTSVGCKSNDTQEIVQSFNAIKNKVRLVLSKASVYGFDFAMEANLNPKPLSAYLTAQLAQAINVQNLQQISNVSEALRSVSQLDLSQQQQLIEHLQNDMKNRQIYLRYLMRLRQDNLLTIDSLEKFVARLRSESAACNRNLIYTCVRLFLEQHEEKLMQFREEFALLTVSDEKMLLIEEFVDNLAEEFQSIDGLLYGFPINQTQEARHSVERILFQEIYQQVLFPNDDADISRDIVLSSHIVKLQQVIRPSHPALCISRIYLSEAPWAFAQKELSYISAYRTPREKLQCITRCISGLISLLNISSGQIPSADDILPVLIFVVIMANPPYLLSTISFISCFMEDKLSGEAQFYWTLFESVVQFIKTMDYLN